MSVMLEQERQEAGGLADARPRPGAAVWKRLLGNPLASLSLLVLVLITLMAVVYPLVSPYGYAHPTPDISASPSARHWLGTDDSGYDLLTRLAVGRACRWPSEWGWRRWCCWWACRSACWPGTTARPRTRC